MNSWQFALQIQSLLEAAVWPTGNAELVFGAQGQSVAVFAGEPTPSDIPPGFPWCLVGVDDGAHDTDHPEFIEQGFTLITGVEVAGDPLGEFSMVGSSVSDLGSSAGRGVLEVTERVRTAVQDLTGIDGAKILLSASTTGSPAPLGPGRHLALGALSLTALCTSALHYAAPQEIAEAADAWSWEGSQCSSRWDFNQYRLVRKTGSAPQTPSDGTVVYTGTLAAAAHTPVSGDTYTIFADYHARAGLSGSTVDGSSSAVVGATLEK